MIGNNPNFAFEFDAITTVDVNSQKIFRDVAFAWSKRFVVPAASSGVFNIVIDTNAVPSDRTLVFLPITFTAVGAGPIFVDAYVGTDAAENGTLVPGSNRDNTSSTTPNVVVRFNPTINNDGVKTPAEFLIPSNGTAAVASFGGQSKDDLIIKTIIGTKYMFRLINQENVAANASIAFTVFEAIQGV